MTTSPSTTVPFASRHIGISGDDAARMLASIGVDSIDALVQQTVPESIRSATALRLGPALSETDAMARLREIADKNTIVDSLIGQGYYGTITPPVIQRNILENPAWYTAYTPYQPEISQGRLEALLNFQTAVSDIVGMDIANASMLDDATAAAEAMTLCLRQSKSSHRTFFVDEECHPQVIAVVQTRAQPLDIAVHVGSIAELDPASVFGALIAHIGTTGVVRDTATIQAAADSLHSNRALLAVTTDLLACTIIEPPGTAGTDVVVGSAQRFGVPLGYGGPHAGFMATLDAHRRTMPGRLVGTSVDSAGAPAHRLALQTREQHIRREKATSNICTAQVLLAVMASMYAVYHGPDGLRSIAQGCHDCATRFAARAVKSGLSLSNDTWFDTITIQTGRRSQQFVAAALEHGFNIRMIDDDRISVAFDETHTFDTVDRVASAFDALTEALDNEAHTATVAATPTDRHVAVSPLVAPRTTSLLAHSVFHSYRTETEMLRYLRRLADMDLALDRTMIPLGSCTMKLNATTEMLPVTWPEFASLHPFAPTDQAAGYRELIDELCAWLSEITGYSAVSLQPNAGSQGELAGLLAIREYHRSRGDSQRTVCLIPSSAHGTNAASAVMAGMSVVVVKCDDHGNVDMVDLHAKVESNRANLAALLITYPSTHGVFETSIVEACDLIHEAGGQVYVDGANLNALVGLARPGAFGADVSHLNLHKTFCIPHGGGGPGVGPVAVGAHLARFLPSTSPSDSDAIIGPVSAAPYGSASILPITWTYIAMMGPDGLKRATEIAILSANYIAARLHEHFPVLYSGANGRVAHECILDLRPLAKETGISNEDVAKRLMDFGFHAPTMSFPVAGTLMIEPTESESLVELDRFCDAMIAIRSEIQKVAQGVWPSDDNPLTNAPHTALSLTADVWEHPYSRHDAAYPPGTVPATKYWPPVGRIDGGYGDRNLVCACPPPSAFED